MLSSILISLILSQSSFKDRFALSLQSNPWTTTNTALELVLVAETIVDFSNTWYSINHTRGKHFYIVESNIFIPRDPNRFQFYSVAVVSLALHSLVARWIPHPYREIFQSLSIGFEGYIVGSNLKMQRDNHIRIGFSF
jgi:hypothetical protein